MKKGFKLLAAVLASMSLVACGNGGSKPKAGLVALHDENSTYDKNFIDAFKAACEKKGYQPVIKTGVPETADAKEKALDLVDEGCKFVFADSFGHETHIIEAAKEHPEVTFAHASGNHAHTEGVKNFSNAFASIYEGRYLAGVAAGMKLKSLLDSGKATSKNIGYIGAYTYAEVISGYTSFYLGVKSIVPDVTMDVQFTGSWYDESAEKSAAETLINDHHCSLISQHADSWGAPTACETAGIPNVSYNGSTASKCPKTYIVSSRINWEPYFEHALDNVTAGKALETDYTGTLGDSLTDGSVALTEVGAAAAEGTEAKLKEVAKGLREGTVKVFDTKNFTVNNAKKNDAKNQITVDSEGHLTQYKADVNYDAAFTPDTDVVKKDANGNSYFAESEFRSAPYFDIAIDGITQLNSKF